MLQIIVAEVSFWRRIENNYQISKPRVKQTSVILDTKADLIIQRSIPYMKIKLIVLVSLVLLDLQGFHYT